MTLGIDSRFSLWSGKEPRLGGRWATASLLYEDPVYYQNYVYASLLALEYYSLFRSRPAWFLPRYLGLLKGGFDDSPDALLKGFLGVDLDKDALLANAVSVVDAKLRALEAP